MKTKQQGRWGNNAELGAVRSHIVSLNVIGITLSDSVRIASTSVTAISVFFSAQLLLSGSESNES